MPKTCAQALASAASSSQENLVQVRWRCQGHHCLVVAVLLLADLPRGPFAFCNPTQMSGSRYPAPKMPPPLSEARGSRKRLAAACGGC